MDRGKIGPPSPPANPVSTSSARPCPHPPPLLLLRTHHTHTPTPGVPFFDADYFNNYAPVMIVFLCGCTYLNLGSGLLSCFARCVPCVASPSFSFDEDFSDTRIDHGGQVCAKPAAQKHRSQLLIPARSSPPPPSARTSHHGQPAPPSLNLPRPPTPWRAFACDANPRSHSARRSRSCPQILVHERKALEDGAPLGKNLNLLSGATSDGEEAAKSKRPARRWNRLNDDNL